MAVLMLATAAAFAACSDDPIRPQVRALDQAEARWSTSGVRDAYIIAQARECFCTTQGSYAVTVIRDTITNVRSLLTGDNVPPNQWTLFRTVNQLFGEVRRALPTAGVLRQVEYDLGRGIPTTVSLDPIRNAVDDEIVYRTTFVGAVSGGAPQ
jgi:hypothetical protein